MWSFHVVNICLKHKIPLQTYCPNCLSELPPLANNSRPGYCSNCEQWLGNQLPADASIFKEEKWQIWVVDNLGGVLANSSNSPIVAKEKVAQSLGRCIEQTTQGNIAAFARLIGLPRNQVWMWSKSQVLPLLKICYVFNLSLLEFLTEESLEVDCNGDIQFVNQHKTELKSRIADLTSVEESLKLVLSQSKEKPLSLTAVAKQLGYNRRTLTRRFPELCQAISSQYIEYKKIAVLREYKNVSVRLKKQL